MILKLKKELNNIKKQIKDNEIKFKEIHKNIVFVKAVRTIF